MTRSAAGYAGAENGVRMAGREWRLIALKLHKCESISMHEHLCTLMGVGQISA
jgi:hypothetical protein